MNFSETKSSALSKKCQVRAFRVNVDNKENLSKQIANSKKFIVGTVIKISNEKHLKLKDFSTRNGQHYLYFSLFNPKEQVSITPTSAKAKDLIDIENMDSLHAFIIVKGNKIASLMQISTNWCETKLATIFEKFDISVIPTAILRKDVIERIKKDGFRALHVNINVDESDFVKKPSFLQSLTKKEPTLKKKGVSGHLIIDARGNSELANSIETKTAIWVDELDSDFYLETKKGENIKGDDLKVIKTYFTIPYGSKTISQKYAKEILEDFVSKEL